MIRSKLPSFTSFLANIGLIGHEVLACFLDLGEDGMTSHDLWIWHGIPQKGQLVAAFVNGACQVDREAARSAEF